MARKFPLFSLYVFPYKAGDNYHLHDPMRLLFFGTITLLVFYTILCVSRMFPDHMLLCSIISIALLIFILWMSLFRRHVSSEKPYNPVLVWSSSIGLGLWSSFILFCIIIDSVNFLLLIAQILGVDRLAELDREYWMPETIRIAFIAALITSFIGWLQAVKGPIVRKISVPLASLPKELAGVTIAQISDLHIGAIIQKNYIEKVVSKVMALTPDIIAITGDMADGKPEALRVYTRPLAALTAPLGVYYITGNHEYYSGALDWIAEAQRLGFTPLLNENRILDYRQKKIMVAGVTDLMAHRFIASHASDPHKAALSDKKPDIRILLAHQPESYGAAQEAGFDLQLSGHTHAGQYFPFSLLVNLVKRYARGLHRYKTLWIYVNPGTGFWGAANRFGIPAEITLLTLTADK